MRNIEAKNISIIDLNFPIGYAVPAMVQLDGVVFKFNHTEVGDDELQTNYEPLDISHISEDEKADLLKSTFYVDAQTLYAVQERDYVASENERANLSGLRDFVTFANAGTINDGTRWSVI